MADKITPAAELVAAERWARDAMDRIVPSHLVTLLREYERRGRAETALTEHWYRDRDEMFQLRIWRDAALSLHQPSDPDRQYPTCTECSHGCGVGDVDWPCSTVQALGGAS